MGHSLFPGSVVEVPVRIGPFIVPHPGVLAFNRLGQPVVLHNSKKIGGKAATSVAEFSDGQQLRVTWTPSSWVDGDRVVMKAASDVARGGEWSISDNCQDFVNRAVTGRNGSRTRDLLLGLLLVGLVAFLAR